MTTTVSQAPKLGPFENLGWTALSIAAAALLLPAIGVKALSSTVLPRAAGDVDDSHYLIQ
ncbi:hypothetical protein PV772_03000 [Pseudarthrobacter sp. CC12]|uniref:hypothetical protein n=1 Tax=Pseudarthrobacter sp. CC12 TaxID=3029193 RepID=UPI003263BBA7